MKNFNWIVLFIVLLFDSLTASWGIMRSFSYLNTFLDPCYWLLLASGFIRLLYILLTGSILRFSKILAHASRIIWLKMWYFLQLTLAWDCFTLKWFSLIDIWDRLNMSLCGGCGARVIVFDMFLLVWGSYGTSEMVPRIHIIAIAGGRKDLDLQCRFIL